MKNKIFWPIIIFLFALTLRVVYLEQIKTNPFFDSPVIDAKMYDDHAMEGEIWVSCIWQL